MYLRTLKNSISKVESIKANDLVKRYFSNELNHLLEASPSDSAVSAKIVRSNEGYSGEIDICSVDHCFKVRGTARNIAKLGQDLFDSMWGQIKDWRDTRFVETEPKLYGY